MSLSHIWLSATPWTAAHQTSLSFTNSRSLLKHASESVMPLFPGDTAIILTITGSDFTLSYSLDFNCHNMSQTVGKTNKISVALFWLTLQKEEKNYEKQQHLIFYSFTEPLRFQYIDICIYIYIFLWVHICVCTHTFIYIFFL